jgi:hypothetical protein
LLVWLALWVDGEGSRKAGYVLFDWKLNGEQ